ncbi:MAG: cation transporter [Dysgonomonas sp.]
MKTKLFMLLSALFIISSGSLAFGQDSQKDTKKKNDKEQVTFDVSMHCVSCQKKIERQVAFEKGVSDLKVDFPNKTVWVEYKSDKTDADKIKTYIESLGYEVKVHCDQPQEEAAPEVVKGS